MTPADIERMAREAFPGALEGTEACRAWWAAHAESLTHFAVLVRARALEDAALVCENVYADFWSGADNGSAEAAAAAIRALPTLELP